MKPRWLLLSLLLTGVMSLPLADPPPAAAEANGHWSEISPPTSRSDHAAIYDPVGDRMLMFGGYDIGPRNDTWALSLSGEVVWHKLSSSGVGPTARYSHVAVHDPVRNRMVIFGGNSSGQALNDVWALSTQTLTWTSLVPAGNAPTPRQWASAIYDPVRDRILLFGGFDLAGARNDVWALSLSDPPAWSEIVPAGSLPPGRWLHSATYDPARDQMLVFGGINFNGSRNDTWALSLSGDPVWTEITAVGPPGRSGATMIHDPVRDRVLVFGGVGGSGNDVWALSLSGLAWTQLTPAGNAPSPRQNHTAIYDRDDDRMVVFGGIGLDGVKHDDSWALSLSGNPTWTELDGSGAPSRQSRPRAIYDPVRDRMLITMGGDGLTGPNQVWALSLLGHPDWNEIPATGSGPYPRPTFGGIYDEYVSIYDPVGDRLVVFGGNNDVWALSLSGTPAWSQLFPLGDPPAGRSGHSAIYDPVAHRMVIFGGSPSRGGFLNDAWALMLSDPPVWTQLTPITSAPPGRAWHSAIYDPQRQRMVVFGGWSGAYQSDVWALTLSESPVWSQLVPPAGAEIGRDRHSAIYDPVRDRMVVFGGGGPAGWRNDVLALSLTDPAWSVLTPSEDPPSGRSGHSAIYDPQRDRMVVFGGRDLAIYRSDAWSLSWASPPTLSLSLSPSLLWPPNHKLVDVHATVSATDGDPTIALVSVTSDEPDSGTGGGDLPLDIQGAAVGTPDFDFQLRSERDESGDGRTYTVCYEARSASGTASQCEVVTVPRHHRGQASLVASAGSLILTCYGNGAMSARNIVAGSVGVATDGFGRSRATTGPPEFTDVDLDGIEDARFVFAADQAQDPIAIGDLRFAYWQADGQVYLADIPGGATGTPLDGAALQFEAMPSSNPARGRASIRYALPRAGRVRVGIYDAMGRQVSRPVDGWRPAGWHTVTLEAGPSSQVYLYRIEWEEKSLIGKVAVLR